VLVRKSAIRSFRLRLHSWPSAERGASSTLAVYGPSEAVPFRMFAVWREAVLVLGGGRASLGAMDLVVGGVRGPGLRGRSCADGERLRVWVAAVRGAILPCFYYRLPCGVTMPTLLRIISLTHVELSYFRFF
jgi:hypothetical protein